MFMQGTVVLNVKNEIGKWLGSFEAVTSRLLSVSALRLTDVIGHWFVSYTQITLFTVSEPRYDAPPQG